MPSLSATRPSDTATLPAHATQLRQRADRVESIVAELSHESDPIARLELQGHLANEARTIRALLDRVELGLP